MRTTSAFGARLAGLGPVCLAAAILAGAGAPASGQTAETFYKGRQIDLVIGYSPGGAYDLYGRLVARFLANFIPGKPTIVARNMPGGGSRAAAAWAYNIAPKDGTALVSADQSLAVEQVLGAKLNLDATKFGYVGNPIEDNNTVVTWYTSGVATIDEARHKTITMGATGGSTSSQYPRAMNELLGTKFKIITGYPGANDINLAMERGEVDGKGSSPWGLWKTTRSQWLKEKKINILVQVGLHKAPDLPDVPLLMDLGANPDDRAVLKLLSVSTTIGRPLAMPPGTPPDRLDTLRKAFDAMIKDPAFRAAAEQEGLEIHAVSGEDLQRIADDIAATPKAVAARLRQIIGDVGTY